MHVGAEGPGAGDGAGPEGGTKLMLLSKPRLDTLGETSAIQVEDGFAKRAEQGDTNPLMHACCTLPEFKNGICHLL